MLLSSQFREDGPSSISIQFAGKKFLIVIRNVNRKDFGDYQIKNVILNKKEVDLLRLEDHILILRRQKSKLFRGSIMLSSLKASKELQSPDINFH